MDTFTAQAIESCDLQLCRRIMRWLEGPYSPLRYINELIFCDWLADQPKGKFDVIEILFSIAAQLQNKQATRGRSAHVFICRCIVNLLASEPKYRRRLAALARRPFEIVPPGSHFVSPGGRLMYTSHDEQQFKPEEGQRVRDLSMVFCLETIWGNKSLPYNQPFLDRNNVVHDGIMDKWADLLSVFPTSHTIYSHIPQLNGNFNNVPSIFLAKFINVNVGAHGLMDGEGVDVAVPELDIVVYRQRSDRAQYTVNGYTTPSFLRDSEPLQILCATLACANDSVAFRKSTRGIANLGVKVRKLRASLKHILSELEIEIVCAPDGHYSMKRTADCQNHNNEITFLIIL